MTNDKPTDYAALIRATNQTVPEPPEWLTTGKHIYSPEYGVGEVMALLGKRLIVKFVEEVNPTQFGDWEEAIALGSIQSSNANLVSSKTLIEETNTTVATISERIQQIPPNSKIPQINTCSHHERFSAQGQSFYICLYLRSGIFVTSNLGFLGECQ